MTDQENSIGSVSSMNDEDESILEEATLGACLRRVLHGNQGNFDSYGNKAEGGQLSEALLAGNDYLASGGLEMDSSDRLQKWRAAGEALRKALTETSGGHLQNHRSRNKKHLGRGEGDVEIQSKSDVPKKGKSSLNYKRILDNYARDASPRNRNKKDESPEIRSVREKIQEIKNRIGDCCKEKEEPHRLRRQRCSRNASFEVNSSESEQEVDITRQKYVPRCRRTSSTSGSPRIKKGDKLKPPEQTSQYKLLLASSEDDRNITERPKTLIAKEPTNGDTDSDTDSIARRLEYLVHQNKPAIPPSAIGSGPPGGAANIRRLSAVLADSLPNLADIESSPCTEEEAGFGESEIDVPRKTGLENLTGIDISCRRPQSSSNSSQDADLDDLNDLEISSQGSRSDEHEQEKPVQLGAEDLESLLDILTESANSAASDQDAEADDEFECDCFVCQQKRLHTVLPDQGGQEPQDQGETIQYQPVSGSLGAEGYSIDLADLTPLDLLLMREGRREVIETMFQNVIRQMLSVYPDLLGEQAPPPAPPTTINKLPIIEIHKQTIETESMCPVCLCHFDMGEEARKLPCQHIFHTLCIQAWLNKSGTCPVCRHMVQGEENR